MQIPESKFRSLWSFTRAARIAKRRYRIPHRGHTIEMDVFQGHHRGLVTADIEFPSGRASRSFQPPPWLGREITGSPYFSNAMLARRHALPRQLRLIESWPFTSKDRKR
jgi:CYTH domain-containing protein